MKHSLLVTLLFSLFLSAPSAHALSASDARGIERSIREIIPFFNARTGVTLAPESIHVYYEGLPLAGPLALEPAIVNEPARDLVATAYSVSADATGAWETNPAGGNCLIILSNGALALTGSMRVSIFAHELFHCYQYSVAAPTGLNTIGRWIVEGQAEWAGEMYANDAFRSSYWFGVFLGLGDLSLFNRDYDAIPFYAHIYNRVGEGVWRRMIQMIRIGTDTAAFNQAIYPSTELNVLQTWPMGIWRDPSKGSDWVTSVPGNPEVSVEFPRQSVRAGDVREFDAATVQHFRVRMRENKMVRIRLRNAHGGLSSETITGTVIDQRLTEGDSQAFCFSSDFNCRCPNAALPSNPYTQLGRDYLDVAITSGASGTGSIEIEEFEPTCCGAEGTLPPQFVGTWRLDVGAYADLAFPPINPDCRTNGSGSQIMQIDSRGGVTRTTNIRVESSCPYGPGFRTNAEVTQGTSTMCMRIGTTAGGDTAFYTVRSDSHFTDFINSMMEVSQPYNRDGPAEPPALAPYVGRWGTERELRGSYQLNDGELLLRQAASGSSRGARRYLRISP
jgi:hypothetical protein